MTATSLTRTSRLTHSAAKGRLSIPKECSPWKIFKACQNETSSKEKWIKVSRHYAEANNEILCTWAATPMMAAMITLHHRSAVRISSMSQMAQSSGVRPIMPKSASKEPKSSNNHYSNKIKICILTNILTHRPKLTHRVTISSQRIKRCRSSMTWRYLTLLRSLTWPKIICTLTTQQLTVEHMITRKWMTCANILIIWCKKRIGQDNQWRTWTHSIHRSRTKIHKAIDL